MGASRPKEDRVFLNIAYDKRFQNLYIAYIVGLVVLGMTPVVTLQIATGETRLDRIFALIRSCRFSVHDLSCIQRSGTPPLPRFNMPFELGLAVAWSKLRPEQHTWIPFESVNYRAQRSLSDLAGSDFNIHGGEPRRVMSGLCSAFVRKDNRPTVPQMMRHYEIVRAALPAIVRSCGAGGLYEARIFSEIVLAAQNALIGGA